MQEVMKMILLWNGLLKVCKLDCLTLQILIRLSMTMYEQVREHLLVDTGMADLFALQLLKRTLLWTYAGLPRNLTLHLTSCRFQGKAIRPGASFFLLMLLNSFLN